MNILVTGASGFLGSYTVAELLRRNHQVRAIVRPTTDVTRLAWHNHPAVQLIRLDLASGNFAEALAGVDTVVHLAAAKTGDFQAQYRSTVTATKNLLKAITEAGVLRLVAISTFSVYDYLALSPGTQVDENSPIEANPDVRDVYARTKLIQENLVQSFAQQGGQVTILRPGIVYGRDALWNASLGVKSGRLWLQIGTDAVLPLTYVENCAAAIANAAERDQAIGKTLNIIDDELPTQSLYMSKVLAKMADPPRRVAVDWSVMRLLSNLVWQTNKLLFVGRLKLPGLLVPARLHARFKPLKYGNQQAKQVLAWQPQYSLDAALDRSCGDADLLTIQAAGQSSLYSP